MGRVLSYLIPPTSGRVWLNGIDLSKLSKQELREKRRMIQMVFQDCFSSMDPRQRVGDALVEVLKIHQVCPPAERLPIVVNMIEQVGLRPEHLFRYPHEFSGGQRQRIGLARALLLHPELVICDEPVSALDVSIQSQILNLLLDLQQQGNHSYLFIAHDISVVKHISDRIGVMYLGHLMEEAETQELFQNTLHPYTKALLSAVPTIEKQTKSGKSYRESCPRLFMPHLAAYSAPAVLMLRQLVPKRCRNGRKLLPGTRWLAICMINLK